MNIFYSGNVSATTGVLDESESHHCTKVLRLKEGDEVILVDGKGGYFQGIIDIANPKQCIINIQSSLIGFGKRDFKIHIAIAPTKNIERFEWFLEKATEIGIDEITPLICQRSERKVIRADRLEKVIVSAVKQSVKAYIPSLHPLTPFGKFMEADNYGTLLIAHCRESAKQDLIKLAPMNQDFTVLIGPEGDFTEDEVKLAISKGYLPVSLGNSRLRTETAGVAACQIIADLMALKEKPQRT